MFFVMPWLSPFVIYVQYKDVLYGILGRNKSKSPKLAILHSSMRMLINDNRFLVLLSKTEILGILDYSRPA